jgi:serine/threonine protein kinase
MGEVFLAVGPRDQRVALKLLRRELLEDDTVRRRFGREVELSHQVSGRYTAKLIGADVDAPQPWLATEFINGPTLGEYIREHGPLAGGSLRALAVALLEAVAAIHAAGIVHRDLTPNNVILAVDGPRVVDFGIAHHTEMSTAITLTGATVGTPSWMAPEQVEGRQATPATDLFSWAAVIAYAATGHPPFGEGRPEAVLYRVVHGEPEIRSLSQPLSEVVAACLAKDAEQRPSVPTVLTELGFRVDADITEAAEQTVRDAWDTQVRPAVGSPPKDRSGRTRALMTVGAAGGVAAAALAAILMLRDDPSEPRSTAQTVQTTTTSTTEPPTTTIATTTTAPPPPAPSPEDLWAQVVGTLPTDTAYSTVGYLGDTPIAMTAGPFDANIWQLRAGAWERLQAVILDSPGYSDRPIEVSDVTGDGTPDFVVTLLGGSRLFGSVVSNATGEWRAVPFDSPDGSTSAEDLRVQGRDLVSYVNNCVPNCATGALIQVLYLYEPVGAYFFSAPLGE